MKKTIYKILYLLSRHERQRGYMLLGMIFLMAILDMLGVASIMPFMTVLANPEVVVSNPVLAVIYQFLDFSDPAEFLFFLGFVVLGTLVISISFKALTTYLLLRFTFMRNYSLSKRLVEGYLSQPYAWFLNRHSADLGKSVLSEVDQVIAQAVLPAMQFIAHGTVVLALLVLLILVDPVLALIITAVIGGLYAAIYLLLRSYLSHIGEVRLQANRERFEVVQEAFGGVKDVKIAGLESAMLHRFNAPAERYARSQAASQVAAQLPRFALEIVAFGGMIAVALYLMAGSGGLQQVLPVLTIYAFAGYRLMPALQQVYVQLSKIRFAGAALDALHNDLNRLRPAESNCFDSKRLEPMEIQNCIQLKNVNFTYSGTETPALNEINLNIDARTTVGFVGSTGSGKTTMVDIILGLLRPDKGQLLVDNQSISPDNERNWQRAIGYVPQQIHLVDDTVAANIAFGIPTELINKTALERASRVANLHDFVVNDMSNGYETVVGERGVRLSGGQRQRIGIARALYHDPQVLILDEATSALDNLTEQAVMDALNNLGDCKTIIIIAHRLTTVRECDQIFVLERGKLMEHGSYEELIKNDGILQRMSGSNIAE